MNRLGFVIASRGLANSIERCKQILGRFGVTSLKMKTRLVRYVKQVREFGAIPSFPITAVVLDRNPDVALTIRHMGAELCVHGLVHNDLSELRYDDQLRHISQAIEIFKRHRIEFEGFRSPYLKHNSETLRAVRDLGFKYDSSLPFYWEPTQAMGDLTDAQEKGLEMGLRFYKPIRFPSERSLPRIIDGLVEIPVSLPDDEILLDRMLLSPDRVERIWAWMLNKAIERAEALIIQLHPERFEILSKSLTNVLRLAQESNVWLTSLAELSWWWQTRMDFRAKIKGSPSQGYQVVGFTEGEIKPHLEIPITKASLDLTASQFDYIPIIGVDPDMSDVIKQRIKQMGYLVENTKNRTGFALYFGSETDFETIEKAIGRFDKPILKAPLWPKGYRAACAVTGDIDCLTLGDFLRRFVEDRR